MNKKTIYLITNFNNKLHCESMVHIDLAPHGSIPESMADNTIIEIRTKDNSYPPSEWRLQDTYRCRLCDILSIHSWPSHGMNSFDFAKWFILTTGKVASTEPVTVYFYKRFQA